MIQNKLFIFKNKVKMQTIKNNFFKTYGTGFIVPAILLMVNICFSGCNTKKGDESKNEIAASIPVTAPGDWIVGSLSTDFTLPNAKFSVLDADGNEVFQGTTAPSGNYRAFIPEGTSYPAVVVGYLDDNRTIRSLPFWEAGAQDDASELDRVSAMMGFLKLFGKDFPVVRADNNSDNSSSAASASTPPDLKDGLVHEYQFNPDFVATNKDFDYNAVPLLTGNRLNEREEALLFSSNYLKTKQPISIKADQARSFSFWIKADPAVASPETSGHQFIFSMGPEQQNHAFALFTGEHKTISEKTENAMKILFGRSYLDLGIGLSTEWEQILITYDDSQVSLFVNGVRIVSQRLVLNTEEDSLVIGCRLIHDEVGNCFQGAIDDFMIFNRALSVSEGFALFNLQSLINPKVQHVNPVTDFIYQALLKEGVALTPENVRNRAQEIIDMVIGTGYSLEEFTTSLSFQARDRHYNLLNLPVSRGAALIKGISDVVGYDHDPDAVEYYLTDLKQKKEVDPNVQSILEDVIMLNGIFFNLIEYYRDNDTAKILENLPTEDLIYEFEAQMEVYNRDHLKQGLNSDAYRTQLNAVTEGYHSLLQEHARSLKESGLKMRNTQFQLLIETLYDVAQPTMAAMLKNGTQGIIIPVEYALFLYKKIMPNTAEYLNDTDLLSSSLTKAGIDQIGEKYGEKIRKDFYDFLKPGNRPVTHLYTKINDEWQALCLDMNMPCSYEFGNQQAGKTKGPVEIKIVNPTNYPLEIRTDPVFTDWFYKIYPIDKDPNDGCYGSRYGADQENNFSIDWPSTGNKLLTKDDSQVFTLLFKPLDIETRCSTPSDKRWGDLAINSILQYSDQAVPLTIRVKGSVGNNPPLAFINSQGDPISMLDIGEIDSNENIIIPVTIRNGAGAMGSRQASEMWFSLSFTNQDPVTGELTTITYNKYPQIQGSLTSYIRYGKEEFGTPSYSFDWARQDWESQSYSLKITNLSGIYNGYFTITVKSFDVQFGYGAQKGKSADTNLQVQFSLAKDNLKVDIYGNGSNDRTNNIIPILIRVKTPLAFSTEHPATLPVTVDNGSMSNLVYIGDADEFEYDRLNRKWVVWLYKGDILAEVDMGKITVSLAPNALTVQHPFEEEIISYPDSKVVSFMYGGISAAYLVSLDTNLVEIGYAVDDSADGVTQNLTLPLFGPNGTDISWVSSNPTVIASDGTVMRPAFESDNTTVTMTATISDQDIYSERIVKQTKAFSMTVIKMSPNDNQSIAAASNDLTISYASGDNETYVTQNITLPSTGLYGVQVSWSSDNSSLIDSSGTVNRPTYTQGDILITMTATITKNSDSATKNFSMTVKKMPISNQEIVALDHAALEITYTSGDTSASVTRDITLPSTGSNGSIIIWSSSDEAVITTSGTVTRPTGSSATVTMTATISKEGAFETKNFTMTVLQFGSVLVSFNTDNGTAVTAVPKVYGEPYGTLPSTNKDGYFFEGWLTVQDDNSTQVNSSTTVATNADHTLYARFTVLNLEPWDNITSSVSWTARKKNAAFVWDNKLWLAHGQSYDGTSWKAENNIWNSSDGSYWTEITKNCIDTNNNPIACWPDEDVINSNYFYADPNPDNGTLWFLNNYTNPATTWTSENGTTWVKRDNVDLGGDSFGDAIVVALNGFLYMLGGYEQYNPKVYNRDVYRYSKGGTWEKIATLPANFPNIADRLSSSDAVAFKGKIYIFGGKSVDTGLYDPEMWTSPDGITWTKEEDDLGVKITGTTDFLNLENVVSDNTSICLLSGVDLGSNSSYEDYKYVYCSMDTVSWYRYTEKSEVSMSDYGKTLFDGKFWIIGGSTTSTNILSGKAR